jgi:YD repeat-containing protein
MLGGTWEERGDFAYDAQGLLESCILATSDSSSTYLYKYEYGYLDGVVQGCSYFEDVDGAWELITLYSYSYDTTGRLDAHLRDVVVGPNWSNWYDYDEFGRLSLKTSSGYHTSNHVTYFYDPQNRLSSALYENYYLGYGSYLTIYIYDNDGRLATILRDFDREDFAYDSGGRLLTITRADLVDGDPEETERITYTYTEMYGGVVLLSDMVPNDHRRELYTFNEGTVPLFPLNFERFMLYAEELNRYLEK